MHETYLRPAEFDQINWQNRNHFYAIVSRVMRNFLVNYALKKKAEKRGGGHRVTLSDEDAAQEVKIERILSIHQALGRLAEINERRSKVLECRFFG